MVHEDRVPPGGRDRVLLGFALGCFGWLLLYATLTYLGRDTPSLARFTGEILYLVPIAAFVGLSRYAARRATGRSRTAWRLLFIASLLWLAGDLTWAYYVYTSPGAPPVPTLADLFYLLRYVFTILGIVVGLGLRLRGLLDALLVAAAGAAIGWQVVIAPLVPETWHAAEFVNFLYPLFSVIIVAILGALLLVVPRRVPAAMIIVGVAFGFAVVMDAIYAYLSVLHPYTSSTWLNVGWQVEAVLMCLAALMAGRHPAAEHEPLAAREVAFLPALVAVLIVGSLALADMILVGHVSRVTLSVALLLLMGLFVRQIVAARERARLTEQLRTAAITDSLTGLYNRRYFEEKLAAETTADHGPLSIILVDLDHFKSVNDTYGHSVGDAVLSEVADRLRRPLRGDDLLCRYGGEEFVCLLPHTDGRAALDLAERLRADLRAAPVVVPGVAEPLPLTASFGVACADPADHGGQLAVDDVVEAADRALYGAKSLGRDRVLGCGPFGQVDAAPALDLPPALIWLADETDRIRGDGFRSAAISGWAWTTAARLGLDEATQQRTAAAARLGGLACADLDGCRRHHDLTDDPGTRAAPDLGDGRTRPEETARRLGELANRPDLVPVLAAHHARHDGTGHPHGLAGPDIPIAARVIAVCAAWADARSTPSPYPSARSSPRLVLEAGRGTRFDPVVLDAFLALLTEGEIADPGPACRPPVPARSGPD
ncbi:diguanylate cyclase [Catellatospora sp. KI3]|uniref:diguanylate cyclase n=1 Tax=Catellatospora sp. KI3 TaxID=3041620 RepID=UPI002482839F|nr:diguanylate cyclase [Catellatospora sp. KI3]MDI1460821.1 diguanylate cyclase [Catellatospora sp. KI3]